MARRAFGVVRKLDNLGRIVIPKETLLRLNIANGDPVEFFTTDDGGIVVKKFIRSCVFCKNEEDLNEFNGQIVCTPCTHNVKKARPVYY